MGKSHRGKCNRCQGWMTWAEMPDGKRLPFDELGQFLLTIRNQGHEDDEYVQAIPIARRHVCHASGGRHIFRRDLEIK